MRFGSIIALLCLSKIIYAQQDTTFEDVIGATDSVKAIAQHSTSSQDSINQMLSKAISKGRVMTKMGMFLHFAGLGVSTIVEFNPDADVPALKVVSSLMGTLGPILACSGASMVDGTFKKNGVAISDSRAWREYAQGWAFTGAGLGLMIVGTYIADSNNSPMPGMIFVFGGLALGITGEVKWIKSMVHSHFYVRKATKAMPNRHDISFIPTFDFKGQYGLSVQMGL